ncbi:uncharacterized protein LOC122381087 [Amphibalanus amphitrite]|uniref:uncharacterized protein LOC122381087 n=1 Tax=Amphibalanus amphitrite TaxID=1232801 RepID=UPI001C907348|nr:uncharacterized protein LOC122381087 [Amphibalanus amphitrite]
MSTNTGSSLDGMVMKVETSTDASVRYFIHFPNMDKRLDRWVSKEDIIQVYRTEHDKNNQDAGAAAGVSSPPDSTKRRLAFDPSPGRHTRQVRKKVTGRVTAASKRSRSLTKPSKRGRVSAAQRRPKDRRGRLVRLAKERLIPTRQSSRKSDRNLTATSVLCPTRANVGDAVERSTTQMSSYPNKTLSLRSRQVRVAAETAQSSELRVVGDTENTTESTTTSRCSDASRGDSKGADNSDDRRSGRQKPAEQARTGTGTGVGRRPAGGTMDVKSNTASWSDGVANAGKWKQRYQPPPGVTVRPFVSSMADSLRPGMKLYVICTVINHGWLRLFSAVIKRVVARRQYHVHYLGFKSCHDELIAPDLIHSVIEVQGKAPVRQLQVPWLAKSTKETPDEPESAAAATPPTLPRECPPRRQRTAPTSQLDSPPSLVQEAKGRAVPDSCRTQTPKASAGASGAVSASPQSTGHASGTSVTVPPAGRASVRAGRSGTAERAALSSGSLPGPAKVGKRRGRPPKKSSASKSKYSFQSPQSHAGVQAFDKDLQSSRTNEASATEEKQACLTERTATAVSALRVPCADDSPTAQRLLTRLGKSKMGGGQLSDRHPKLTPLQQKSPSLQLEGSRPANGAAGSASSDASDIVVRCTYSGSPSAVCAGSSAGTPAEHTAGALQIKKRGRPRKKPSLQGLQSRLPRPDTPPEKCGASPSTSALTAPEESPRQRSASKSVGTEQRRPAAEPADQRRHRGRPLRSLTAASTPQAAAGVAEDVSGSGGSSTVAAPAVPPPRAAPSVQGRAAPTADAHVGASGPSDKAATPPNIPCLKGALGSLADGDVVYVVYGMMEDGTKVTYPAKVLKVDRQLYYARFHIHYLGWAHRYDEWIAEEVIYSVVDRNTPDFNVKTLKRRLVPSSRRQEQLSVVRPCSVDLSVNNICFFSALSKDRARVNDRRIQTLGAATASGRPAGCS